MYVDWIRDMWMNGFYLIEFYHTTSSLIDKCTLLMAVDKGILRMRIQGCGLERGAGLARTILLSIAYMYDSSVRMHIYEPSHV